MGIKDLKTLIKKHSPNSISSKELKNYAGEVIAIDTSIYFYKFLSYGNHLSGFVRQILLLLENDIIPLYIFDGKPPDEKNDILKERKDKKLQLQAKKDELEKQLAEADDSFEIKNIKQKLFLLSKELIIDTPEHITSAKKLFELFGVPYLDADGEAEILCAKLCQQKYVYACLSEDSDLLANGATLFLHNFKVNQNFIIEYNLKKILEDMKITMEQFIDICILCGCDYTNKIEGIGKESAYRLIKKLDNIENVIQFVKTASNHSSTKKYIIPENFNYLRAREIFLTPLENLVDKDIINTKLLPVNINELEEFMKNNCERLSQKYYKMIHKILLPNKHNNQYKISVKKTIKIMQTTTIESYFTPIVDDNMVE